MPVCTFAFGGPVSCCDGLLFCFDGPASCLMGSVANPSETSGSTSVVALPVTVDYTILVDSPRGAPLLDDPCILEANRSTPATGMPRTSVPCSK